MDLEERKQVRLWGVITDASSRAIPGVQVKLLKKERKRKRHFYQMVQQTLTDSKGRYQFFVDEGEVSQYKIIVLDEV